MKTIILPLLIILVGCGDEGEDEASKAKATVQFADSTALSLLGSPTGLVIPEPATWMLMLGNAAAGILYWRSCQ